MRFRSIVLAALCAAWVAGSPAAGSPAAGSPAAGSVAGFLRGTPASTFYRGAEPLG